MCLNVHFREPQQIIINKVMAIYRIKRFSAQDPSMYGQQNPLTSKDLQLENMKLQREIMRNQRQEQRLREEERRQLLQTQKENQRQEMKATQEEDKNQIRLKESQNRSENNGAQHIGLYKKSTTAVKPVSMK